MLARRNTPSLFDSFFTEFPVRARPVTNYTYNDDYKRTYSVAGYSREDLTATANPKTNRLTIRSEDDRVYYTMTLPSSKYDVTQAEIEVNNGLLRLHIPLLEEEIESVQIPIR